jgi:cell division protein FtsQ
MDGFSAFKVALVSGVLFMTTWFAWREIKAQGADLMPIKYVRVEGAFEYIAKDRIKRVLKKQLMQGFYNADLQKIQQAVRDLPWAEQVEVKRIWPDAVKVQISEQRPVARWGKDSLLNNQGELFDPDNIKEFQLLPLIIGPDGQEKQLLEVMKGLSLALQDQAMTLKAFYVNERRAWKVILTSGMQIKLGRTTPLKNIQRFLKTVDLLGEEQVAKIAAVDLRYPNGYAVTWKADAEEIDWKKVVDKENQG